MYLKMTVLATQKKCYNFAVLSCLVQPQWWLVLKAFKFIHKSSPSILLTLYNILKAATEQPIQ